MTKPDPGKEKEAQEVYAQLARGDYTGFETRLSPEARAAAPPEARQKLYALAKAHVPAEAPKSISNVVWTASSGTNGSTYTVVEDYEYAGKYVEVTTVLHRPANASQDAVQGFHFNVVSKKDAADRDLTPKTPFQFGVAAAVAVILLATLAALVQVFTRKGVKRRWLWFLFILLGVGSVKLNWGTGALVSFSPLYVQLLSLGVVRDLGITSPWIVSLSLPLGALIFLSRAKAHAEAARVDEQKAEAKREAAR